MCHSLSSISPTSRDISEHQLNAFRAIDGPVSAEILDGDLRPPYLTHLAMAYDGEHDPEETIEAPIPAGLDKLSAAQRALAELYGLSDALIAAAISGGPPLAVRTDSRLLRLPLAYDSDRCLTIIRAGVIWLSNADRAREERRFT
jgi:hypothetical protein